MCILQTVMQNWKVNGPPLFRLLFIFVHYPSNVLLVLFKGNGYVWLVFIFMECFCAQCVFTTATTTITTTTTTTSTTTTFTTTATDNNTEHNSDRDE